MDAYDFDSGVIEKQCQQCPLRTPYARPQYELAVLFAAAASLNIKYGEFSSPDFFFSVTKLDVVLTSDLAGGGRKHRGTRRLREDVERRQKGTEIDTANMGTKNVQRYRNVLQ